MNAGRSFFRHAEQFCAAYQLCAVELRKPYVDKNDIRTEFVYPAQGFLPVGCLFYQPVSENRKIRAGSFF